jgi:hypothetical protein
MTSPEFAQTVLGCWKFGQAEMADRAARLDRLLAKLRDTNDR